MPQVPMTYTVSAVERLLRNYFEYRSMLEERGQQLPDNFIAVPRKVQRERPLGMTTSWPFMDPTHAKPPNDGKRRARLSEELHCAMLDVEDAFRVTPDDDLELLYKYHVFKTHTLDDFLRQSGNTSRGSMHQRIRRVVKRFTDTLNTLREKQYECT